MTSLFKKIIVAHKNSTTYRAGLVQTKAYRILKHTSDRILAPFDLTSVHWAFLGVLSDGDSMRAHEVATELKVDPPFVTTIAGELTKKGFIQTKNDPTDTRVKILSLTTRGKKFIEETEPVIRAGMRPLLKGISIDEVITYLSVLDRIVKNSE